MFMADATAAVHRFFFCTAFIRFFLSFVLFSCSTIFLFNLFYILFVLQKASTKYGENEQVIWNIFFKECNFILLFLFGEA